jgi:parallel beta-helix repeat protein
MLNGDTDWFNYTINYLSHRAQITVTPSWLGGANLTAYWNPTSCAGLPSNSNFGGQGSPSTIWNSSLPPGTYYFNLINIYDTDDFDINLNCKVDCGQCPPQQGCSMDCGQTFTNLRTDIKDVNYIRYTIPSYKRVTITVTPSFIGGFNLTAYWNPTSCAGPPSLSNYGGAGSPSSVTNESLPPGTYYFNVTHLVNDDTYDLSLTCSKVANGYSCSNGDDCQSGLCVQGICRASCSGYNKLQCSDDATNNWNNDGICLDSTEGWQCVENIPNYCDFAIVNLTDTFISSRSNTYHCLNQSFSLAEKNAINFTSGVQNSFLDCLGYNLNGSRTFFSTYGVYLTGSSTKNNTIKNCNITNFREGIYLYNGPNNNTIINNRGSSNTDGICLDTNSNNNILINNTANNNTYGISLLTNSNNNILINNTANSNTNGICLESNSNNNTITGGSVAFSSTSDFYLYIVGKTNNFTNTNFTANRTIYFYDTNSWFNYNNETTGNIWLKTNVSAPSTITRKLISWTQSLMRWNDTPDTIITARYNITGLKPNTNYIVYNNSITAYPNLQTDSSGNLNFTIYLGSEHNITVQEIRRWLEVNLTEPSPITWTSSNPKPVYRYNTFNVNANVTCHTDPPGSSGGCGSISSGVRYNESASAMKLISTTDVPPMWTSGKIYIDQYIYNYWNFSTNSSGIKQGSGIANNGTHFFITNRTTTTGSGNVTYMYDKNGNWVPGWIITPPFGQYILEGIYCNGTTIGITNNGGSSKNVTFYDMNGNYLSTFSVTNEISGLTVPTSLVFNQTYVWVSASGTGNKKVYRYFSNGTYDITGGTWDYDVGPPGTQMGDGLEFNGTNFFIADISGTPKHVWGYDSNGNFNGWNFTLVENSPWGLDYDANEKNFYIVGLGDGWIYRYERNISGGAGNPISLGTLTDGQSNQVTFQVNATSKGDYKIDVNFTSDLQGVENNTDDSYIRVKDLTDEYLIVNSIEIKPSSSFNPISSGNVTTNVTVNITNSTYMHPTDNCTVRIFNTSDSYSSPTIGPLPGRIQKSDSQWQCFCGWNMEYWQNPGPWNVSVDLKLWMGLSNFTSKNFTYGSLYAWNDNITTGCINWTGLPGQTVNSSNAYPMRVNNTGNEKLSLYVNGTDFVNGQSIIGVRNASFSNISSSGPYYNLNKSLQLMINISVKEVKDVYFRVYIPLGFINQQYNNTINISSSY